MKILCWMVWLNIFMFVGNILIGDYGWAGINGAVAVTFAHWHDEIKRAGPYMKAGKLE